jgi:hypothetical protein
MLAMFWGSKGPVLEYYQERGGVKNKQYKLQ